MTISTNRMALIRNSALLLIAVALFQAAAQGQQMLPRPDEPFQGKIGLTYKDSTPVKPQLKVPANFGVKDPPNILIVLIDDAGFGQTAPFGGSIPTPTLDRIANNGLRYTRFHTTALCSPTRAALLTGRNHHSVGSGVIGEAGTGFPGYSGIIPASAATFAEVLREYGYANAWFGKNHNVPDWETSLVGPFDRWADGLGFDYFYGFVGGDTDQYSPALVEGKKAARGAEDQRRRLALPFDDRPRRPCDPHDPSREGRRPAAAVLRLLRHWCNARPAPGAPGMDRQVQGQVRHGLGQVPRGDLRPPEGTGRHSAERETHAAARLAAGLGLAARRRKNASTPA